MDLYIIRYDSTGSWYVQACTTPTATPRFVGSSTGLAVALSARQQEAQIRLDSDALALARAKDEAAKYSQVAG